MGCRLDKFIWAVRLAKTRSKANELISKKKVLVNGQLSKSSRDVKAGDEIQVVRHNAVFSYRILDTLDRRVGAKLVQDYLLDVTPEEELEKYKTYLEAQRGYRHKGSGKPSKKDRRSIDNFLNNSGDL